MAAALGALALLSAAACGTGAEPTASEGIQTTQQATPPEDRLNTDATVNVRLTLEPTSLNTFTTAGTALDQLLLDNVYQGLVTLDTEAGDRIVPALATAWEQSPDGLTYTFHLAPNARFHDGSPLTAEDAVWSLRQQLGASKSVKAEGFSSVAEVSAPDPATVRITLKERDTLLLWQLTQRGGIVYKRGTDFAGLDGAENGSGPFALTQWNRGASITLTRRADYWGVKPKVAKVVFHYIKEPNSANNAQLTGQTDIQVSADATLLQPFLGTDKFTVLRGTTTDKFTLAFNGTRAPFTNPDVRHAIRKAIDKQAVIKAYGSAAAIGSAVAPQDPWYEDLTGIDSYDPESARKLLAAAGFGTGLKLTLDVPNIYPVGITDVLVSDLKQVGVELTVRQLEFPAWLSKVFTDRDFQLSLVDHAEARDLDTYTKPGYYFGYDAPQVRGWYTEARRAASDADRDALLKQLARRLSEDAAADWLFLMRTNTVVRAGVYGVPHAETSNRFDLSRLAVGK
ncbi:ABC transporter substrate-binding protein [Nocardia panacis]|uniref:ABC transporter substrate-binding protein n=1 Tax=Nocardia panacis TaxID=2340916 RepID=A0A3A4KKU7_9NOCA|nr:ABC transporter substrate-binding protein [Nocardia panacis]